MQILKKYLRVLSSAPLLCRLNFEPLCVGKTCCNSYTSVLTIPSACQQTLFFFYFLCFLSSCHFDCFSVVPWACPRFQRLVHEDTALLHSTAFLLQDLEWSMLKPFFKWKYSAIEMNWRTMFISLKVQHSEKRKSVAWWWLPSLSGTL